MNLKNISYHFTIIFSTKSKVENKEKYLSKENFIYKQTFAKTLLEKCKIKLKKQSGDPIKRLASPYDDDNKFLRMFRSLFDDCFPLRKNQNIYFRGSTKGSHNLLKENKNYTKFFKKYAAKKETNYKTYKNLFGSIEYMPVKMTI